MPIVHDRGDKLSILNLEYNLVSHCNFACEQCSHLSPFMRKSESSLEAFRKDVTALAQVARTYRFRFVGGEPLLHRGLLEHVALVRESGLAREIYICTNGSLIDRIDDSVIDAVDQIAVSWYPATWDRAHELEELDARVRRAGRRLKVIRSGTFRQMNTQPPAGENDVAKNVFAACKMAHLWSCQTFLDGQFYLCSRPLFTGNFLEGAGVAAPDLKGMDGIPLHEPDLKARLKRAYSSDTPLESCTDCLGTSGKEHPWRAMSPQARKNPELAPFDPWELELPGLIGRLGLRAQRVLRAAILRVPDSAFPLVTKAVNVLTRSTARDGRRTRRPLRARVKKALAGR